MRQITVFTSNGVGKPITVENEPERQIRIVLKAARSFFKTNGGYGADGFDKGLVERMSDDWGFSVKKAIELDAELKRLEKLL